LIISYSDAEYFNLSTKETRIAKATRPARVPTLEQIRHVVQTMTATTDIEQRDRALIAFTILTGARDGPIASFKLRHIDIAEGRIDQDAREVRTKFAKSFVTTFFPVGDDIRAVVADWVIHLRTDKLWGLDDPLFPATKEIMQAHAGQTGSLGDGIPGALQIVAWLLRIVAGHDERADSLQHIQHRKGWRIEDDGLPTALAIGQEQTATLEIDVFPPQV